MSDLFRGLGGALLALLQKVPFIKTAISNLLIQKSAKGPLPIVWTTAHSGRMNMRERLKKEHFSLMLPQPEQEYIDSLPPVEKIVEELFTRDMSQAAPDSRVSLLQIFIAQHLTDAVFQSDGEYGTEAPHEIILNQIYGNNVIDRNLLREKKNGKLKSQYRATDDGKSAEFPAQLCEKERDGWRIKTEFENLSWLKNQESKDKLFKRFKDKPEEMEFLCATALFQGNLTAGNFALTTLLHREHNRIAEKLAIENPRLKGDDNQLFDISSEILTLTYMKLVMEEYINTFVGLDVIELNKDNFFHETKRWCEDTPIPFHFNILYRLHSAMPNELIVGENKLPFEAFLANNKLVMESGLINVIELASKQPASQIGLLNTPSYLLHTEIAALAKARKMLQPFNAHRTIQGLKPAQFEDFDPRVQDKLKALYGSADRIEYMVGIFGERKSEGLLSKFLPKGEEVFGQQLTASIGQHAFRHILSNPLMRRERFNEQVLTKFGMHTFETTKNFKDIVLRNTPEIPDMEKKIGMYISTHIPEYDKKKGKVITN